MTPLRYLVVGLLVTVIHGVSAAEHPILGIRESNREAFVHQREVVHGLVAEWRTTVLEDERLKYSSDLNVLFSGDAFLKLVDVGPVATPHLIALLLEDHSYDFVIDHAMIYIMRGTWSRIAGVEAHLYPGRDWSEDELEALKHWWAAVGMHCHQEFMRRRKAFDARLAGGEPSAADLWDSRKEEEWQALRRMGLYSVPSLIKRIAEGSADDYDLLLLEAVHTPATMTEYRMFSGSDREWKSKGLRFNVMPVLVQKSAPDWLAWWESSRQHYWWLLETGGPLADND